MTLPQPTPKARRGLAAVLSLVRADLEGADDEYPPSHDVHSAVQWLRKVAAAWNEGETK